MAEDDFEIKEPSEYNINKNEVYSHSTLLMFALKSVAEKRAKEMRDGYFNIKFDKMGNAHRVWIPDSREEFIESVESLTMIQSRDYDEEAKEAIQKIKIALKERFEKYCEYEKNEWEQMHPKIKDDYLRQGTFFREGLLSDKLPYKFLYIRDKVDSYTEIVSIIQCLIKRLGDYQEEIWEN